MRTRAVLVLAILAALVWAPPTSAAANLLDRAEASPTSGTTATRFGLRVSYEGRFPALGVTVTVADRAIAMTLLSGTAADGTWQASARLPAGTWPVLFTALAERGNSPTLVGPTLTVVGASATTPSPQVDGPSGDAPTNRAGSQDTPGADTVAHPTAAGTITPVPAGGDANDAGDSLAPAGPTSPSPTAEPFTAAPSQPSTSGPSVAPEGGDGDIAEGVAAAEATDASSAAGGERLVAEGGAATPMNDEASAAPEPEAAADEGLLDDAIRISAVWAAMLLVAAAVMLGLVLRRRRREAADAEALTMAAETEALLERRALRRAHLLMPEDPIVASMALDEREPAARRPERRRHERRRDGKKR